MLIPGGALYRIATPIVARSLVEKDMERTGDIYSRTSLVLTVLGALILGPVLINIDEIVSLLPRSQEFNGFFLIILFAGLAKWFELATSINTQIIVYSNYYRFNLVALIALGVLNVVMNYWLISKQGIVGAALATLLSLTLYNLIKLLFIYMKMGLQPFSLNTLKIVIWAIISFLAVFYLPKTNSAWASLFLFSTIFVVLFMGPILWRRWVPDLNDFIANGLHWFRNRWRK